VESLFHTIVTSADVFTVENGRPVDVSRYAINLEVESDPLSTYSAKELKEFPE